MYEKWQVSTNNCSLYSVDIVTYVITIIGMCTNTKLYVLYVQINNRFYAEHLTLK